MKDLPQFVPQKVCLSCDGCCRFKEKDSSWRPKITEEEISQNCSGTSDLAEEIFSKERDGRGYIKAVSCQGKIKCTFLHLEDNICHVYGSRPYECQLYPFLLTKKDDKAFIAVHLSCPHIQEKWTKEEYNDFVKELEQYFQNTDVLAFLRRNLELLSDYSQYDEEISYVFPIGI